MTCQFKKSSQLIETMKYQNVIFKVKCYHRTWLTRCFLAREIKESKNTFQVNHSVDIDNERSYSWEFKNRTNSAHMELELGQGLAPIGIVCCSKANVNLKSVK